MPGTADWNLTPTSRELVLSTEAMVGTSLGLKRLEAEEGEGVGVGEVLGVGEGVGELLGVGEGVGVGGTGVGGGEILGVGEGVGVEEPGWE